MASGTGGWAYVVQYSVRTACHAVYVRRLGTVRRQMADLLHGQVINDDALRL